MEDTHGVAQGYVLSFQTGLNPYYNGRYSWRLIFSFEKSQY